MEIKKPTVKKGWIFTPDGRLSGYYFPDGAKGILASANLSAGTDVFRPLNHFSYPPLTDMPVGAIFELEGQEITQKISPRGKVLETKLTGVKHKFQVVMGNQSRHVSGAKDSKEAWRIV